ncbi:MAG: hypothetical protein AAF436_04510 [Myxococcota bacterium]
MSEFYTTIHAVRPGATKTAHQRRAKLLGPALALGAVSLCATWVGLSGDWVGDDWHMVDNYVYQDWAELGAVFHRNAAYYLFAEDQVGPYRPITMLTLVGTHLLSPRPWLHHLIGWLLHAVASALLFVTLRQQLGAAAETSRPVQASAFLAALFFMHPVQVEAYVWINGRSDLLAGFWLASFAFLLERERPDDASRVRRSVVVGLVTFLGAGSKLPFVLACLTVWLGWVLRRRPRDAGAYAAAIGVAIIAHAVLRSIFAPFSGELGTATNLFTDPGVWLAIPKLLAQGMLAIATFRAEAMQSLSWVLFGPWEWPEVVALAAGLGVMALLARRRDWASLVYIAGAFVTLAPVVAVSRSFWIGFDRYLYLPLMLLSFGVAPYLGRALSRVPVKVGLAVAVAALTLAAIQTHTASSAYADQEAYDRALERDHPTDPSIRYYFARAADRRGDEAQLRAILDGMPGPPWPRPIIVPVYELAEKTGNTQLALRAVALLTDSVAEGASCKDVAAQLERWRLRAEDAVVMGVLDHSISITRCDR